MTLIDSHSGLCRMPLGASLPNGPRLEQLRERIAERYGFWISDSWAGQLTMRLNQRVTATGRASLDDYLLWLRGPDGDEAELPLLVESMLNGETHFLRTEPHFAALLKTIVPEWRRHHTRGQRLRIASLGCSTGEEPYSIAMILREELAEEELADVEITGVDLSNRSLGAARSACYDSYQLRDLSPARRERWFTCHDGRWQLRPELRASVRFLQHNLLTPLPFAGLDVIFCRNVLIYFRRPDVAACLAEFSAALRPGGYLLLGHSESAFGFPEFFEPLQVPDGVIYLNKPSRHFNS
jgi:chemotaxis protein methyltransferase CheR